jgi:integrase
MRQIELTDVSFEDRARIAEEKSRNHLEPHELKAFWDALKGDPFWNGYFRLQYYFGCRCSEVAILTRQNVSFKTSQIMISRLKKSKKATEGKGFINHTYDLPPKLVGHLKAARAVVIPPDHPMFFGSAQRSKTNTRCEDMASIRIVKDGWRAVSRSTAQKHFLAIATAAKVPEHLRHTHVLRHTRATLLFANGAAENQVQYLLDHSSPQTTSGYIGWAKKLKDHASVMALLGDDD